MYDTLHFEESGDIATITLARPRINMAMVRESPLSATTSEQTRSWSWGEAGRFSLGIDFAEFRPDQPMDIHGFNKWEKICARIERLPKAIVAVIEGECRGGGARA